MRTFLGLVLAASILSSAGAAMADPADAWRPMYPFIGAWKGTRSGAAGPIKVTRTYASAATNHHLEIIEKGSSAPAAVWGMVSFDAQKQALVLRHFAADGSASDVAFDQAASSPEQLVFANPDAPGARTRITYERSGPKAFVERVEQSTGGGAFALVSETRFVRKD